MRLSPCLGQLLGVRPASGPSAGGVLVLLSGLLLGDGSDYRCRFGATFVTASYHRSASLLLTTYYLLLTTYYLLLTTYYHRSASFASTPRPVPEPNPSLSVPNLSLALALSLTLTRPTGDIRCFTPPHPSGTFNLSYSLNGRHFENASGAAFHLYPYPYP